MIVNGRAPTEDDHISHAVILFATRKSTAHASGRLGGGSIISSKACITVAHLLKECVV